MNMTRKTFLAGVGGTALSASLTPSQNSPQRILFLGDSITYSGGYIVTLDALSGSRSDRWFINCGLPSETVSGLSEPGHAGGSFPRPDLHERLERVLKTTQPDYVFACYGMNDGIYYPLGEERFAKYKEGVERLVQRVGAKRITLLTPPVFDSVPIKAQTLPAGRAEYRSPYEGYDEVLTEYAKWLTTRKGWSVIDIHTPIRYALDEARKTNPNFRFADDGVHINEVGHFTIAKTVLKAWSKHPKRFPFAHLSLSPEQKQSLETATSLAELKGFDTERTLLPLFRQRHDLRRDAYLFAAGHLRPGMPKGKPVAEAEQEVLELDKQIEKGLTKP